MSQLISKDGLIALADLTGLVSSALLPAVDTANAQARRMPAQLVSVFADDVDQALAWYPDARAMYTGTSGSSATGLFGAVSSSGLSPAQGLVSRSGLIPAALFGWLERLRRQLQAYGSGVDSSIVDVPSFAAYYNATASHSCLFSPDFAAAFCLAYGGARQLAPGSVFAPVHVPVADVTITGVGAASAVDTYPRVNGYSSPAPSTDAYGNLQYVGGLPIAQGFAPPVAIEAVVTADIDGACALTMTAPDESGDPVNWTATLDNLTAGSIVALTPSVSGKRIGSAVTSVAVAGTATTGAVTVRVAEAERTIS